MSVAKDIAIAALPSLIVQLGEGVREHIRAKREATCAHGRPGGKLCPTCSPCGAVR